MNIQFECSLEDNDSEEFDSAFSSNSEDESTSQKVVYEKIRGDDDIENSKLKIGMVFSSKELLNDAVRNYKVMNRKVIKCTRSDRGRVNVAFSEKNVSVNFMQ